MLKNSLGLRTTTLQFERNIPALSIVALFEPGFFAVMKPVQSAQKTVSDTSFKVSLSPPFSGHYFLLLSRDLAMLFSTA